MRDPKLQADLEKIHAEIDRLIDESSKIAAQSRWFPFVATAIVFAAAYAFVKLMELLK